MRRASRGFSSVEAVLIVMVILALVGVGFWVGRQSNDSDVPSLSSGESIDTPAAPEVKSVDDLEAVEQTLDKLNPEAGSADSDELDTQAENL